MNTPTEELIAEIISLLLTAALLLSVLAVPAGASADSGDGGPNYRDIGHLSEEVQSTINWLWYMNMMSGTGDGKFSPDVPFTAYLSARSTNWPGRNTAITTEMIIMRPPSYSGIIRCDRGPLFLDSWENFGYNGGREILPRTLVRCERHEKESAPCVVFLYRIDPVRLRHRTGF